MTSVKLSWVALDRIVSKEALSDEAIRRQLEQNARPLRSHTASMSDEDLLAKLRRSSRSAVAPRHKADPLRLSLIHI